jgi:hypothetical protein
VTFLSCFSIKSLPMHSPVYIEGNKFRMYMLTSDCRIDTEYGNKHGREGLGEQGVIVETNKPPTFKHSLFLVTYKE